MNSEVEAQIKKQQQLLKRRLYYDQNAERIRAQQLANYYKKKGDKENKTRGRKAKPRDIVITVAADGCVKVN